MFKKEAELYFGFKNKKYYIGTNNVPIGYTVPNEEMLNEIEAVIIASGNKTQIALIEKPITGKEAQAYLNKIKESQIITNAPPKISTPEKEDTTDKPAKK